MKTIKSSKDITTLEVDDVVIFRDSKYIVCKKGGYFLRTLDYSRNDKIFIFLGLSKIDFIKNLGIDAKCNYDFPEVKSLEALTTLVSALFKEYEKQNELPKTWEEFCVRNKITRGESYIDLSSMISELGSCERNSITDRNICTSQQEAEAFLALMQLRQLRKAYVKDWEPDWTNEIIKYCIEGVDGKVFLVCGWYHKSHILSFPTHELAEQFLTNFEDLLEIAKPLL